MNETKDIVYMPFIEGKLVSLHPIVEAHFDLYCKWLNSPECRITSGYKFPQTMEEIKKLFEPKEGRIKEQIYFEIRLNKERKPIGLTGFIRINYFSRMGIINSTFGEKPYKREDIALETNKLILNYGFGEMNLHKIGLTILPIDDFSQKIIKTLGFKKELTLKNEVYFQGEHIDLLKFFLLKEDWEKFEKE
jgi:RimJ/RimL family protein N-acetyltransferase